MKTITHTHNVTCDGVAIYKYHPNIGEGLPRHEHTYAHLTICCAGKLAVRKEGLEIFLTKDSQPVNLVANEWHELEAVEDGTVFLNVFSEGKY